MIRKMAFDWRIKLFLEKMVSVLPFGYDYNLYSYFGHKFLKIKNYDPAPRIEKGLQNLELIRKITGFKCEDAIILELGTGLSGVDILLFYMLGAHRIITLDHKIHLKKELMVSVIRCLYEKLDDVGIRFDQDVEKLQYRLDSIKTNGSLEDLLASCNIFAYSGIIPNIDIVGDNSVDLLYSESCLQRIPTPNLEKIFEILPALICETAISFNRTDTKDFNSIYFKRLWGLDYLRYNDLTWSLMTAEKFNNQNRLRECEFIRLLESAGLNTLYVESFVKPEDVEKLKSFRVAKRFEGIPLEELAIVASKIISVKPYVKEPIHKYLNKF